MTDSAVLVSSDGKQVLDSDVLDSIEWESRTGVLGSQLSGIWPRYSDLTDINSADVDLEGGVVVTGDDFGLVKLFRFPCRKKGEQVFRVFYCTSTEDEMIK